MVVLVIVRYILGQIGAPSLAVRVPQFAVTIGFCKVFLTYPLLARHLHLLLLAAFSLREVITKTRRGLSQALGATTILI